MGVKVKQYLGERVDKISKDLKIPKITVESVIREYLNGLVESGLNYENIVIDNLVSIKVGDDGSTHCRVSSAFKQKLLNQVYPDYDLNNKVDMPDIPCEDDDFE